MRREELVAEVSPRIGKVGWAFYFTPETNAVGESLGLSPVRFYFLGRGGVLGNVEAEVVGSAFGYFSPGFVRKMWTSGSALVAPRQAARAFFECCAALGRSRLSSVDGLDDLCTAAEAVNEAADSASLALYAGWRAEPLADDPPARALQLISVLRELRGSAHLLAVRAQNLDPKTAHYIKRPNDMGMFGWSQDDIPTVTESDRAKLASAEELTNALLLPAYYVLDDTAAKALVTGVEAVASALDT